MVAVPTVYTSATLAEFLRQDVGPIGAALGWSVGGNSYDEPIIDTLLAYGVSDLADATDIAALRALARRAVWQQAVRHLASRFDFSLDQQSISRSQMQKMAKEALAAAEADVLVFASTFPGAVGGAGVVDIVPISRLHDPYTRMLPGARVLR